MENTLISKEEAIEAVNKVLAPADCLLRCSQVKEHLRDNACGVAHVQKGEVGEEEIHGAVQMGV